MECESCGKTGLDKEGDFCYGCGHILCSDCCVDEDGELIGGGHSLRDHKRAFERKQKLPKVRADV